MKKYILLLLLVGLFGCSKKVIVKFEGKEAEFQSAEPLTQLMLVNSLPKIVLRTPDARKSVVTAQAVVSQKNESRNVKKQFVTDENSMDNLRRYDVNLLYSAIEKQLFQEGFKVRDRLLFNEVLQKADKIDYAKVASLTDTDLILEIVAINPNIEHEVTSCYQQKKSHKKRYQLNGNKSFKGAMVEFRLIHMKLNEVVGTYKYYYTPCQEGCSYFYQKGQLITVKAGSATDPNEILTQESLEHFLTDATRQLAKSIR